MLFGKALAGFGLTVDITDELRLSFYEQTKGTNFMNIIKIIKHSILFHPCSHLTKALAFLWLSLEVKAKRGVDPAIVCGVSGAKPAKAAAGRS